MKKFILPALAVAMLGAVPAFGQAAPLVVEYDNGHRTVISAAVPMERRIEIAAEAACEKPFIRDLKGQVLYAECVADARLQVATILAERAAAANIELALR